MFLLTRYLLKQSNNKKLSEKDDKELRRLCKEAGYPIPADILLLRNKKLSWKRNTAEFSWCFRNTIFIAHDLKYLPDAVPKVAHELDHRTDFINHPIWYLTAYGSIIGRYIYHEPKARQVEIGARKGLKLYYDNLSKKRRNK